MTTVPSPEVGKPDWASAPIRMDPCYDGCQSIEMERDGEIVLYRVSHRGAVVRRMLDRSKMPVSIALAPTAFRGVAARAMEEASGEVTVTLELYHDDPLLSVPLLVASDLYDVAADWRSWSDLFRLPMLMVEADGTARPLEETLGTVRTQRPKPRRRSCSKDRRPRFLARRKPGLGVRMVVDGDEIIARS
ncbi:DUF6101 family protein [Consotaella salsifontis]|uniref:Uncharacterized protein n=1 Tax=Consotaella salsifontis TaxID=1365950 RepID=A0A1T4MZN4_9HYPH|nr:DUF6101 family protein [Consotaella salsifontis]SJZ72316.1 hypothetical protein SAMN05428963_102354 [Consotaella salsifontis]